MSLSQQSNPSSSRITFKKSHLKKSSSLKFTMFSHTLLLTSCLLLMSSYSTANPASLTQHLNEQLKKIFFPNSNPVGSSSSPIGSYVSSIGQAIPVSPTGNRGPRALASAAASATKNIQSNIQSKRKTRVLSLLALPKGLRAALPLLGFKKPSSVSPITSASVLRPVFTTSLLPGHRANLVGRPTTSSQQQQFIAAASNQQVYIPSSPVSEHPIAGHVMTSSQVSPTFGFPSFASLPPFLGDVSLAPAAASGLAGSLSSPVMSSPPVLSSSNPASIGEPALTQEELEQYASGQSFVRHPPVAPKSLRQHIQFIPLSEGLRSQRPLQPPRFNFPSSMMTAMMNAQIHQMHFPSSSSNGPASQEAGQQDQQYHPHVYQDANSGQQDPQYQGHLLSGVPQNNPSLQEDSNNGEQPTADSDPEKVMYIYVDEEGKTVASKVADPDVGPEVALPEGYVVRQVGGPAPPKDTANNAPQTEGQQDPASSSTQEGQPHSQEQPPSEEMSYATAPSFTNQDNSNTNGHASPQFQQQDNPSPASVSYATEQEAVNAGQNPGQATMMLPQQEDARQVIVSYPGHPGQFLVRLKKKPQEYQQQFPTTPSGQVATPVVTSAHAIDSTLSPPDSSQDMVFMLGDYKNYMSAHGMPVQPADGMQSDQGTPVSNASPLADDFLSAITGHSNGQNEAYPTHTTPAQDDYLERPPPSMRPPLRGTQVRERSTHGGWIPIPKSLPPTAGSYSRDPNAVSEAEPSKKQEDKSSSNRSNLRSSGSSQTASHVSQDEENKVKPIEATQTQRQPKVIFDDSVDTEDSSSKNNDNSGQSSHTRVSYSVSSSISSSVSKKSENENKHLYYNDQVEESTPSASERTVSVSSDMIRDEEVMRASTVAPPTTRLPSIQKRSKYNVAAVFDHEFKPIMTSPSKSLEDLKDHEIIAAPKGSFGLRLAPGQQMRTTRSLFYDRDSSDEVGHETAMESTAVPSSSLGSFSQRTGLTASTNIEESLKKPTGQFLVPIPGVDGKVKAYVVLSA